MPVLFPRSLCLPKLFNLLLLQLEHNKHTLALSEQCTIHTNFAHLTIILPINVQEVYITVINISVNFLPWQNMFPWACSWLGLHKAKWSRPQCHGQRIITHWLICSGVLYSQSLTSISTTLRLASSLVLLMMESPIKLIKWCPKKILPCCTSLFHVYISITFISCCFVCVSQGSIQPDI